MIYLLSDHGTYFADHIDFPSISILKIKEYLEQYSFHVEVISLQEIERVLALKNVTVLTISSQKPYLKKYLEDIYSYLKNQGNTLIPNLDLIKCHENKGYQELHKRFLKIPSLSAVYTNIDTFNSDFQKDLKFPLVVKTVSGSGSRGVRKVKSLTDLTRILSKHQVTLNTRLLVYVKELLKLLRIQSPNKRKLFYFKDHQNLILQELVPNLTLDYKALIFFDKIYVLQRNIQPGDFRASGSGLFSFPSQISPDLLDFAADIFRKLDTPFVSLDICYDGKSYHLLEFQCIHFGPYTQINSPVYYKKNIKWESHSDKASLEEDLSYSLAKYLQFTIKNRQV